MRPDDPGERPSHPGDGNKPGDPAFRQPVVEEVVGDESHSGERRERPIRAASPGEGEGACAQHREVQAGDHGFGRRLIAELRSATATQRRFGRAPAQDPGKHLQRLAIDLTLIPYHGRPFRDLDEIYRSQAKSGTSHFHAYATAYVVRKGLRYTVALTGVKKGESLKDVVQRLLRQAASVGVRPRLLLLDRGFYSVAVVRYLQAARLPVPDAGGLPRPIAQAARWPQRQLCLVVLEFPTITLVELRSRVESWGRVERPGGD